MKGNDVTVKTFIVTACSWILSMIVASTASAQGTIHGKILDESREPLPGVLVRLKVPTDTLRQFITGTDLDGTFKFSGIPSQTYRLVAIAVGRGTLTTTFRFDGSNLDLGDLIMMEAPVAVQGVTIEGRIPPAIQAGDTTNYAAISVKVNEDATMGNLLSKLPGMVVSNGTVTVGGETVQQVLIDGKPYFGQDPAIALQNIPAGIIDRIQVYDQESDQAKFTGFDDGQDIKTINIITRRPYGDQQFGKIGGGFGEDQRYDGMGNVNLFDGDERISLLGSSNNTNQLDFSTQDILGVVSTNNRVLMPGMALAVGAARGANPFGTSGGVSANNQLVGQQQGINTTSLLGANALDSLAHGLFAQGSYFFNQVNNQNIQADHRVYLLNGDSTSLYNQNSNVASRNFNNRISGRMDYWPDESDGLTVLPVLYFQSNRSNNLLGASTYGNNSELQSNSSTNTLNDGYNMSGHVIYRHRFDLPMQTISLNVGAGSNQKQTNGSLSSSNINSGLDNVPGDSISQQLNYFSNTQTVSANLIYTQPLAVNAMVGLFYNPSFTRNTASKRAYNFDPATGQFTNLDVPLSNDYSDNYTTQNVGIGYLWRGTGLNLMGYLSYQYSELQGFDSTSSITNMDKKSGAFLPMALLIYQMPEGKFLRVFYRTYIVAPAVTQLQPVVNNSNPLLLTAGNPNLTQSYTQSLMARYNLTRPGRAQTISMFLYANYTNSYFGNDYIIPSSDTVLSNGTSISKGAQLTYPVNLDGYWNIRSFFTFGFPFDLISSALNLNAGVTYTRTPGIVNGIRSASKTIGPSGGFVVASNISRDFDFTISYTGNYNFARNTLLPEGSNNYYSHTASVNWYWQFWNGIVLNNQVSNELTSGLASGYNQDIVLWNISLGKKFFTNDRGELQLSVNDLLGQNKNVQRTVTDTYIDDTNNEVLTRYVMLTFSYTLR